MWTSRPWIPAALLAAVGAAAWLLLGPVEQPEPRAVERPRQPDYVVRDFTAVETNAAGSPDRRLSARELRQFVAEDLTELERPHLLLYQDQGPPWSVEALHGLLLDGGDEVRLRDQVRVTRAAFADASAVRLETAEISLWPERHYAEGDRPVRIESGADWATGSGIQLWYEEPMRATLEGRARMFLVPEGSSDAPPREGRS
jgi:lipopolysaccharide export system protein LptC